MRPLHTTKNTPLLAVLTSSLLCSLSMFATTVTADPYTYLTSSTSLNAAGETFFVTPGPTPTPFAATINPAVNNYISVAGGGIAAFVSGDFNTLQVAGGAYAVALGVANTVSVVSALASVSGFAGQLVYGDGAGIINADLTDATVSGQVVFGGFAGQITMTRGTMLQTAAGLFPSPSVSGTMTVSGLQVMATQNQFDTNWRGSGNSILVYPSQSDQDGSFYPPQPTIVVGGTSNTLSVEGVSYNPLGPNPPPTDYAVGVTIGEGPGNFATLVNRVDATVTGFANDAFVFGTHQPKVYVASSATVDVRAFGATVSGAAGGVVIATASPLYGLARKVKRDGVAPTDINTISVESGGIAVVSGSSIAATAGPSGVVVDLGDAYVSVQSGGYGVISPNVDPNGPTPTFDAGATASLAMFAKAVVQDGSAPIQTPPGSILVATRISPDQSLVQAVPNPSLAGRARRARRALDNEDRPLCSNNLTHCPISSSAFECIDTLSNLESCGGCWYSGEGKDCSTIEGVDAVECVNGACVVQSCADGYHLAPDADKCVLKA